MVMFFIFLSVRIERRPEGRLLARIKQMARPLLSLSLLDNKYSVIEKSKSFFINLSCTKAKGLPYWAETGDKILQSSLVIILS